MAQFTGTPGTSSATAPSSLKKATVKSESGTSVSLVNGFIELRYYESLLQDSLYLDYQYVDTGNTLDGKSLIDGFQENDESVVSAEFDVEFEDNNGESIKLDFNVNKINPADANGKQVVTMNMITRESLMNEWIRLGKRFDGKISDHITTILEEKMVTQRKVVEIQETENNLNFIPNNKKAYFTMNWLSPKSIPSKDGKKGDSAGFILFETADGYYFKSIDSLFAQNKKKSFIYTGSTDKDSIPPGYDGKILEHKSDNRVNLKDKLVMGMYGTTIVRFNPRNCTFEVIEKTAEESKEGTTSSGKDIAKIDSDIASKTTRTTFMCVDDGVLPEGDNDEQIKKNDKETLDQLNVVSQSIRRYNQMYSAKETITIPGDFSLHAGDAIYVDFPASEEAHCGIEKAKEFGGKYIISDLCHYVSTKATYTKMNIIRDSFGRKPKGR